MPDFAPCFHAFFCPKPRTGQWALFAYVEGFLPVFGNICRVLKAFLRMVCTAAGAAFAAVLLTLPAQAADSSRAATELETAILRDNPNTIIALLLAAPANGVNASTPVGAHRTPALLFAMQQTSWRAADALLLAPALDVNMRSASGETPVMLAAIRAHRELLDKLLAAGAHVNQPGWTPLHYAASADLPDSVPIAQTLLERHAYIDAASPNGTTPLMLAAQYGSQAMVQLLLDEGADPSIRNQLGLAATDFAHRSGRDYLVELIENAQKQWRQNNKREKRPHGGW